MPTSGSMDYGQLGTGLEPRPRRQAPRDLSPPPRPRKTPRFDPEVRRVSPPAHAMINRRRAHSPSPTILDLPNTPEPILPALCAISDEDEEEELEDYVVVARPLLEPPARRHSTSALSGRPAVPLASEKTLHPASPTESKFAAAPAPLSSRRSSFGASCPARLLSPPLFDRSSILVEPIPERPDFECLTSVLQARYRASSLTLSSSVPCPGSDTSSVSRSHGKLVKPRRPSHSDATIPHPSADPAASSGRKRPLSRPCTSNMAM